MKRTTRVVDCGGVKIGGGNPVVIQSMTNTNTADVISTVEQIRRLEACGCQIARVAVPDMEAAARLGEIKKNIGIPLIADIHFDYKLAIESINQGADGIRINPGNIGSFEKIDAIIEAAREKGVKIRIGVNGGSLEKDILEKHGRPSAQALVESALRHVEYFEKRNFTNLVISLKSSDIRTTIDAYEMFSNIKDYPLHIGITESGSLRSGTIKSAVGIGYLLLRGVGDTMRVSLTADPCEEIYVAKEILKAAGLMDEGVKLISCPTCGRTRIDMMRIVEEVESKVQSMDKDITVAIMGCAVNGPGEAREADIGIAGGNGEGLLFKKGKPVRKIEDGKLVEELLKEIEQHGKEQED